MFRDTPSQYTRQIMKNEGYATFSLAFAICSVGVGVLGNGVRELAWAAVGFGVLGILIGILGVNDRKQKKKDSAWLAIAVAPIGALIGLDAIYWRLLATAWGSF